MAGVWPTILPPVDKLVADDHLSELTSCGQPIVGYGQLGGWNQVVGRSTYDR